MAIEQKHRFNWNQTGAEVHTVRGVSPIHAGDTGFSTGDTGFNTEDTRSNCIIIGRISKLEEQRKSLQIFCLDRIVVMRLVL